MANNIKELKTKKFIWIDIAQATQSNLKFLKNEFGFETADLNECLPMTQRQKILKRNNYVFVVLQFPFYNREIKSIETSEVDLFIGKNFLITIHEDELTPLVSYFHICQTDPIMRSQLTNETVISVLHKLLNKLYNYCYPILNHINLDINQIEKDILQQAEEQTVHNILIIKRNIVNFQKAMQSHRNILNKLMEYTNNWRRNSTNNDYNNLISHTKDIWDYLTNYKDIINALHETQESITNLKINEIMKTLTIFSVVVFPLTLLAAIFGMNTIEGMPFVNSPYGFWYIIGIMVGGMFVMFGYFKKRKWL